MSWQLFQVDAFSEQPFGGNPAAVCLLPSPRPEAWMQAVAAEMNLSETAFLQARRDGFDLRWFTPTVEVDLCGHATLASAHVLWLEGLASEQETIDFHTKSGVLSARRDGDWIVLDFPALSGRDVPPPDGLLDALGVATHEVEHVQNSRFDHLVHVRTAAIVARLQPDFARLGRVETRGVIVTAAADGGSDGVDFVSRFFAPAAGVDEDPVTGSAHCVLGPYWVPRLGKETLLARQISRRSGDVRVTLAGERVLLGGKAVLTMRGELLG